MKRSGRQSTRHEDTGAQPFRLTARSILELEKAGPFAYYSESGDVKHWACPKYDGNDYDEQTLRVFTDAVSTTASTDQRAVAFRALGIVTGDGDGDVDIMKLLQTMRKYYAYRPGEPHREPQGFLRVRPDRTCIVETTERRVGAT